MRKFLLPLAMLGSLLAVPAHAQATRTWVSGVGDDVNPCSRTAPCKTFAGAISKTARNGEINCLDPGGFGAVTITKSITIDCHEVFASILHSGTTGVIINFNSFDPTLDLRKTVRLRNINFNAADTGINGIRIIGAAASTGSEVFIEDCVIDGNFAGNGRGISDERTTGGELTILNTVVRNNSGNGIVILAGFGTGAQRSRATLENVRVHNSDFGIAISNATVMINNSTATANAQAGIDSESNAIVNVSNSVSSNNGIGIQAGGGSPQIRLANNEISDNVTGFSGATLSYGNNRALGNATAGPAPTPLGADSHDKAQQ